VADRERRCCHATALPELNELVTAFVRCVESILGPQLVGVYLVATSDRLSRELAVGVYPTAHPTLPSRRN
jgi:hypothetical protein